MRAAVIEVAGGPEVLKLQERPVPKPATGWALVRVKAFGINRSELFTRQGHSPSVLFPRILGIEAVGQVVEAPGGEFPKDQTVATAMGGMGRQFDGSYAEYTCVPAAQVQALDTKVDWTKLAALPEMLQTAWGSRPSRHPCSVALGCLASCRRAWISLRPPGPSLVDELRHLGALGMHHAAEAEVQVGLVELGTTPSVAFSASRTSGS